jgi:hypothetical protein
MNTGTKVIRKADANKNIPAFGIARSAYNDKTVVEWTYFKRHTSTIKTASLVEVTPELEMRILTAYRERNAAHKAKLDKERIYLCTNVNPTARGSLYGHPKPLPLTVQQVVDGKCFYCGHPVINRGQGE